MQRQGRRVHLGKRGLPSRASISGIVRRTAHLTLLGKWAAQMLMSMPVITSISMPKLDVVTTRVFEEGHQGAHKAAVWLRHVAVVLSMSAACMVMPRISSQCTESYHCLSARNRLYLSMIKAVLQYCTQQ